LTATPQSIPPRPLAETAAIAASLANLWFFPVTKTILVGWIDPHADAFTLSRTYYFAALFCIAILTVGVLLAVMIVRRLQGSRRSGIYALCLFALTFIVVRRLRKYKIISLGYFADHFSSQLPYAVVILVTIALITTLVLAAVRYLPVFQRSLEIAIMLITPFAIMIGVQLLWKGIRSGSDNRRPRVFSVVNKASRGAPVVLLIFDELDRRAFAGARMPGFQSPAFDSLSSHAFVAANAVAPTLQTETAIPSILSGRRVITKPARRDGELVVTYSGADHAVAWASSPNLFDRLEAAGYRVGVVGWYHSYCSGLAKRVTTCWTPAMLPLPLPDIGLVRTTSRMLRASFALDDAFAHSAVARESALRARALSLSTDPSLSLVYAHLSVPHSPFLRQFKGSGYFGNLMLVDETLADLKKTMGRAGVWDRATIIVTGDHGAGDDAIGAPHDVHAPSLRSPDVPFIVKLPHQELHAEFTKPFSTEVIADLVPELIAGRITNPEQLTSWLSAHSCDVIHCEATSPLSD
jgi:hypothetical protein